MQRVILPVICGSWEPTMCWAQKLLMIWPCSSVGRSLWNVFVITPIWPCWVPPAQAGCATQKRHMAILYYLTSQQRDRRNKLWACWSNSCWLRNCLFRAQKSTMPQWCPATTKSWRPLATTSTAKLMLPVMWTVWLPQVSFEKYMENWLT